MSNRTSGRIQHSEHTQVILLPFQICRIMENDCIGFTVTNRGEVELVIEKEGQEVAGVSVLVRTDITQGFRRR